MTQQYNSSSVQTSLTTMRCTSKQLYIAIYITSLTFLTAYGEPNRKINNNMAKPKPYDAYQREVQILLDLLVQDNVYLLENTRCTTLSTLAIRVMKDL